MSTEQLEKVMENPVSQELEEQKPITQESQESKKQTRKAQKEKKKQAKQKLARPRRRIFPIWLRLIVVLTLSATALIVGLMIGYGVLGDGNPIDALKIETWQHLIDIVYKPA